jgi:hypothetical protein
MDGGAMAFFEKIRPGIAFSPFPCDATELPNFMASNESYLFALGMLCTVVLSLGVFLMLGVCMFRAASREKNNVDDLIGETGEEEKAAEPLKNKDSLIEREEWEKNED